MPINSFENYPMTWKPQKSRLVQPYYLSLAKQLEEDVQSGALLPHTKLPPQRELADFLDLNLSTIAKAFKLCRLNGLLYAITGSGTYVSPNAGHSISIQDERKVMPVIEMGMIKPMDFMNDYTKEALQHVLAHGDYLLDYSQPFGSPYQKQAAQKWLSRFGLSPAAENIFLTSGAQNALAVILISLFQPGDKIATDVFTYPNFIELANMLQLKLIPILYDEKGMLPEDLEKQCRLQHINGVYLMPTYSNPTGTLMDAARKAALAKVISAHGITLIEDDIYAFLAPKAEAALSALCLENACYIASLSKSLCAGIRVAFLHVPARFATAIARGIYNLNVKTASLNSETVSYMIHSGIADTVTAKKREEAYARNLLFQRYFPVAAPVPFAFSRWLPLPSALNNLPIERMAMEMGLQLYHSNRFLVGSPPEKQFLRLSLSSADTWEELESGLKLLHSLLAQDETKPVSIII